MPRGRPRKTTTEITDIDPRDAVKDEATLEREKALKAAQAEKSEREVRKVIKHFYYELVGNKLIKRVTKGNGAKHSYYIGNIKKQPDLLQNSEIKENLKK